MYPNLPDPQFRGQVIRFPYAKFTPVSHNTKHTIETFELDYYVYEAYSGFSRLFWKRIN